LLACAFLVRCVLAHALAPGTHFAFLCFSFSLLALAILK